MAKYVIRQLTNSGLLTLIFQVTNEQTNQPLSD